MRHDDDTVAAIDVPSCDVRRRALIGWGTASLWTAAAGAVNAQADYPNRYVRMVLPFPPGGGTELSARFVGRKFTELTGQPVVIDPKGGGNGFIAVQAVLQAPRDGYTLMFASNATLATNAALFRKLPYDPIADFQPLSLVIRSPIVVLTAADSRFRTLADYVAFARAEPGRADIGTGSAGYQLMGALFGRKAGFDYTNVPYKSASDTVLAIVSGQVAVGIVDITSAMPLIRGGKARALAVASQQRNPGLPNVPTAAEAGVPDFTAAPWNGLVAPRGVPASIVEKLSGLFARIMAMPGTQSFFAEQFVEVMPGGAAPMQAFQREEVDKWKRIAAEAKIELQ